MGVNGLCAIFCLMALFVVSSNGFSDQTVPSDVMKMRQNGYVYADYPGVFDADEKGITIKVRVYFTEKPKNMSMIFAMPNSYYVAIAGHRFGLVEQGEEEYTYLIFGIEHINKHGVVSHNYITHTFYLKIFPYESGFSFLTKSEE